MLFSKVLMDDTTVDLSFLEDHYLSTNGSSCFIVGSGPSMNNMPADLIAGTPAPKFMMNLAGSGILRPNLWTSYDPTTRFHKSLYLDPSIMKFVDVARRKNLVPETSVKVCDCPSVVFIRREHRPYSRFIDPSSKYILDCLDSLVQAIDIAYRLGFRTLYMVGTDMRIKPSQEMLDMAREAGVTYSKNGFIMRDGIEEIQGHGTLGDFDKACTAAGLTYPCDSCDGSGQGCGECEKGFRRKILTVTREKQYSFDETKTWKAAINTDEHYFRVSQHLRQGLRSISKAGLKIISCTPGSRLNDYFEYMRIEKACAQIKRWVGDPANERTVGKYTQFQRAGEGFGPTKDIPWHGHDDEAKKKKAVDKGVIEIKPEPPVPVADDRIAIAQKRIAEYDPSKHPVNEQE